MAVPLSPNVEKAIERLFPDENKEEVARLLIEECADNMPNSKNQDAYQLEDIRFRVLMISEGDVKKLYKAVQMANRDFRDVVGNVYKYKKNLLGDDLEHNIHSEGFRYGMNLNWITIVVAFSSSFFLKYNEASAFEFVWVIYAVVFACIVYIGILFILDRIFRKYCGVSGIIQYAGAVIFNIGYFAFLGFLAGIAIKIVIKTLMYLLQ